MVASGRWNFFISSLLVFQLGVFGDEAIEANIYGGTGVPIGKDWSFMAQVIIQGSTLCGGALIDPEFVITAAHCVRNESEVIEERVVLHESDFKIHLGTLNFNRERGHDLDPTDDNAQLFSVEKVLGHGKFEPTTLFHDVAILKLTERAPSRFKPIRIDFEGKIEKLDKDVIFMGWGVSTYGSANLSETLQFAESKIYPCGNGGFDVKGTRGNEVICIGRSGEYAGSGDSGGPVFYGEDNPTLVGVISAKNENRCRSFTVVQRLTDLENKAFITEEIKELSVNARDVVLQPIKATMDMNITGIVVEAGLQADVPNEFDEKGEFSAYITCTLTYDFTVPDKAQLELSCLSDLEVLFTFEKNSDDFGDDINAADANSYPSSPSPPTPPSAITSYSSVPSPGSPRRTRTASIPDPPPLTPITVPPFVTVVVILRVEFNVTQPDGEHGFEGKASFSEEHHCTVLSEGIKNPPTAEVRASCTVCVSVGCVVPISTTPMMLGLGSEVNMGMLGNRHECSDPDDNSIFDVKRQPGLDFPECPDATGRTSAVWGKDQQSTTTTDRTNAPH